MAEAVQSDFDFEIIANQTKLCIGAELKLSSTEIFDTYQWDGPNDFISNNKTVNISEIQTLNQGTYTLYGTKNGCTYEDHILIEITEAFSGLEIKGQDIYCEGETVSLTVNQTGGDIKWTNPQAAILNSENLLIEDVKILLHEGLYTVEVTNELGCSSKISKFITINRTPKAVVNIDNEVVCAGEKIKLRGNGGKDYNWTGVGFTSEMKNPIIETDNMPAGKYDYVLTVTSSSGCTGEDVGTVEIVGGVDGIKIIGKSDICDYDNLQLSASSGFDEYIWKGPNNFFKLSESIFIENKDLVGGMYEVIAYKNGCQFLAQKQISIMECGDSFEGVKITGKEEYSLNCNGDNNFFVDYKLEKDPEFIGELETVIENSNGEIVTNGSLSEGKYIIKVYNEDGAFGDAFEFEIKAPLLIEVAVTTNPVTCSDKGRVALEISGGTEEYTCKWSDLSSETKSMSRKDLAAGDYSFTITDAKNCTYSQDFTIEENGDKDCEDINISFESK